MKTSVAGSYGMNDLCLWNVFWVNYFAGSFSCASYVWLVSKVYRQALSSSVGRDGDWLVFVINFRRWSGG